MIRRITNRNRVSAICLASLALLLAAGMLAGCGDQSSAKLELPTVRDVDQIATYRGLNDKGYELLMAGDLDGALEAFHEQVTMFPDVAWGYYNLACANARTGNIDEAFVQLGAAVDHGWDDPEHLGYDPDMDPLRDDPRYAAILERVKAKAVEKDAMLAAGMPEYATPPTPMATDEEVNTWQAAQRDVLMANRMLWRTWEYRAALLDFQAQKLSALREIHKDDPEFDYGLERMRAIAAIPSPYESQWGGLGSAIVKEADRYLAGDVPDSTRSEALLFAGHASLMHLGFRRRR